MQGRGSTKQKIFKKRQFRLVAAAALVVIILAIAGLLKSLGAPAEGTLSTGRPPAGQTSAAASRPHTYNGKYVSFTYPARYHITTTSLSSGFLEAVNLYATDHTSKQLSIGVIAESLDQDSGVLLRRAHPETYHLESSMPSRLLFTSAASDYQITEYISNAGRVASIAFSCPYKQDLRPDFNQVSSSFKWR